MSILKAPSLLIALLVLVAFADAARATSLPKKWATNPTDYRYPASLR